ncbi:MAG: biotin/lipoyl-binding protein [Azonexus sp.]|nr:biotin/lipoyl-binding protein [Azonexus sp.]
MLFRPEVSQSNATSWIGELRLAHSIPTWIASCSAVALAASLIAYGIFGTYARKARVSGILVSQGGELNVTAPSIGRVMELRIKEGQTVLAGETLMVLDTDRPTEMPTGTKETAALINEQIENRLNALASQRQSKDSLLRA